MTDANDTSQHIVVHRARGKMLTHSAAEIFVRDFPPVISDEPPARGGENRGPTPLEHILIALCA
ncbi:MAG: OsmC family protein [Anaerolineae bacterium]